MDLANLQSTVDTLTIYDAIRTETDRSVQNEIINTEAAAIAEQHDKLNEKFDLLFGTVGCERKGIFNSSYSTKINLGTSHHKQFGEVKLVAQIVRMPMSGTTNTVVSFMTRLGEVLGTETESYTPKVTQPDNFAEKAREFVVNQDWKFGHIHNYVSSVFRADQRAIHNVEQTQAMLWEAVCNPELNPEHAARAAVYDRAAQPAV